VRPGGLAAEGWLSDRGCGEAQEDRQGCEGGGENSKRAAEEGFHISCTYLEARSSRYPWGEPGGRHSGSPGCNPVQPWGSWIRQFHLPPCQGRPWQGGIGVPRPSTPGSHRLRRFPPGATGLPPSGLRTSRAVWSNQMRSFTLVSEGLPSVARDFNRFQSRARLGREDAIELSQSLEYRLISI